MVTKRSARRNKSKLKPEQSVAGLVISLGYVESGRPCPLIIRHLGIPFPNVVQALTSFADYMMENFENGVDTRLEIAPREFTDYISQIPSMVASGGTGEMSWDEAHVNDETWWPWDNLRTIYKNLKYYYEYTGGHDVASCLVQFLTLDFIRNPYLRQKIADLQRLPTDDTHPGNHDFWKNTRSTSDWKPVCK